MNMREITTRDGHQSYGKAEEGTISLKMLVSDVSLASRGIEG
jgi:hypothetical protein